MRASSSVPLIVMFQSSLSLPDLRRKVATRACPSKQETLFLARGHASGSGSRYPEAMSPYQELQRMQPLMVVRRWTWEDQLAIKLAHPGRCADPACT